MFEDNVENEDVEAVVDLIQTCFRFGLAIAIDVGRLGTVQSRPSF